MVSLYVERLSIGCERVIGRSHLQVSKVRRDDDDRRPVWCFAETGPIVGIGADSGSSTNPRFLYSNLAHLGGVESAQQSCLLIASGEHLYRWVIGVSFQTVSNTHWLCNQSLTLPHEVLHGKPYSQITWFEPDDCSRVAIAVLFSCRSRSSARMR